MAFLRALLVFVLVTLVHGTGFANPGDVTCAYDNSFAQSTFRLHPGSVMAQMHLSKESTIRVQRAGYNLLGWLQDSIDLFEPQEGKVLLVERTLESINILSLLIGDVEDKKIINVETKAWFLQLSSKIQLGDLSCEVEEAPLPPPPVVTKHHAF